MSNIQNLFILGIGEMDAQHRRIIECLEGLVTQARENNRPDEKKELLEKTYKFLKEYGLEHFRDEEELMLTISYPDFPEHVKEHAKFRIKVQELEDRLDKGDIVFVAETAAFLKSWLIDHINVVDRKYAIFYQTK